MLDGLGHRPQVDLLAVLVDGAGDPLAVRAAEDAHRELRAAGAHQAGEPDDLAAADLEAGALADQPVVRERVLHRPVADLEERVADGRGVVREAAAERTPDHAADDPVLVDAAGLDVQRLDGLAVADDRDRVRDLLDLVQLVTDDDRADALALQTADQVQQVLRVRLVQCCGRLVEDEQLHRLVERLGDLHQLLLADAERLDLGVRIVGQPHPGQQVDRAALRLGPVDHAELRGLVAQEDVLGDRELRDQRELLMDDHDAGGLAGADVLEPAHLALVDDVALVGAVGVHPGQHLHQGGLAGAVLAADRVDLAGVDGQRDLGQCADTGELLGDRSHLEDRRSAGSARAGLRRSQPRSAPPFGVSGRRMRVTRSPFDVDVAVGRISGPASRSGESSGRSGPCDRSHGAAPN